MKRLWALLIFVGVIASVGAEDSPTIHAVEFFEREVMEAAFAKGQRLATSSNYNVSASRRDTVGKSEIHENVTDLFYFKSGVATFVTGGELVDARESKPGEWRGSAIRGGTSRALTAGDMIIVPKGTCHWFSAIDGVIEYYIVKVIE